MPDKPGIYLRGGIKTSFDDEGSEIGERELVVATDTGEIGTQAGWIDPSKFSGGKVKNIYYAETSPERQDIYSQTPTVITGLSLTITPETDRSSFIIVASVNSTFTHVSSLLCYLNGTSIRNHTNNSNQAGAITTIYDGTNITSSMFSNTLQTKIDTSSHDEIIIDIRGTSSWSTGIYHMYINDRDSNDMRSISSMVIYEIERDT